MAPRRPNAKKAKSKARSHTAPRKAQDKPPRQLLAEATALLEQADALAALAAANEALEATGDGGAYAGAALTLLGEIHLELGEPEQARAFLERAAAADPEGALPDENGGGVEKFMYLAQLSEDGGHDSVRWFNRGAEALRAQLRGLEAKLATTPKVASSRADLETLAADRKRRLADVLCAVAEVYMTDLSWEADCEAACEGLVTEATMLAPESADVWQTVASVRISQSREDDARAALGRSLEAWQALAPDDPSVPAFPMRVALVRLLMTVGLLEKAIEVVERLVKEDDQSVEVWYLGGYGLFLIGEALKKAEEEKKGGDDSSSKNWEEFWVSSRRWFRKCLKLFGQQMYEDDRLRDHAVECLDMITKVIGEAPEEEDGEEDGDEWEDEEDGDGDEEMAE
ncbi:uncharacterized protein E0L32_003103 [Thyridium curvatum]|uniref:Uncharacterized protein n=1 Tax=Thyridium curvatum TaxID=1093900 RepID=A0A507BLA9_9PEZI|nr:uncharacterized protein E0L32_003103 [Thyridium curvatum]TPX17460.1 hypothetical protein E0L32_003103 [Thyridium curvatum]